MAADDELIAGVHAVSEALIAGEAVKSVIVAKHRERDAALKDVIGAAQRRGILVQVEPESWFRRLRDVRHQHVAAILPGFSYADWTAIRNRLKPKDDSVVVAADHIEDPQNLGAIMRTAEAAGSDALVIPDRRSAAVTGATRRAAAGAASHLAVVRVPNLVRSLEDLKSDGFWVTGLASTPGAVDYTTVDYLGKCALVVGAEGKGLSRLASERCDRLVKIPMRGKVASLNAAAACAVVLYEAVRQRSKVGL